MTLKLTPNCFEWLMRPQKVASLQIWGNPTGSLYFGYKRHWLRFQNTYGITDFCIRLHQYFEPVEISGTIGTEIRIRLILLQFDTGVSICCNQSDSDPRWSLNPCCRSKHGCWKHGLNYTYLAGQDHSGQVLHAASGAEPIAFACHWLWTFSMHLVLQQLPRGPHAFLFAFGALLAAFLLNLLFSHSFSWSSS